MNWVEKYSQSIRYYHGSKKQFPIGFVLLPQIDGYVSENPTTESFVEKHRPPNKLGRRESVFMVDDVENIDAAGGYEDYIYIVDPIGQVDKSDLSWITELEMYLLDDIPEQDKLTYAMNYWNGIPHHNHDYSLFEYRARSAKIIGIVD